MSVTETGERVRLQVMLAVRMHCDDDLSAALEAVVMKCAGHLPAAATVTAMTRMANDPFSAANPGVRPYQAMLEIEHDEGGDARVDELIEVVSDGLGELDGLVHRDLSVVTVGVPVRVIHHEGQVSEARYVYLMRRRHDFTHEEYLRVYADHARFGHQVVGVTGYTQVHIDADRARRASRELDVGGWNVDSVTELYIKSFAEMFAPSDDDDRAQLTKDAFEDELRFVDRANSVSFGLEPVNRSALEHDNASGLPCA